MSLGTSPLGQYPLGTDGQISAGGGISVSIAVTDGADVLAASIDVQNAVSSAITDGADILAASVGPQVAVSSATTDGADVLASSVDPQVSVQSAATDGADVLAALVSPLQTIDFSANWTDGRDTLVANIITGDASSGIAKSDGDEHTKRKVKERQKRRQTIQEQLEAIFEPAKKQSEEIRAVIAKPVQVTENPTYIDSDDEDVEILLLMA